MKAQIMIDTPLSRDVSNEDLKRQWEGFRAIESWEYGFLPFGPGLPTGEEVSAMVPGDTDALFSPWVDKVYLNEAFLDAHPNLRYVAILSHGHANVDYGMLKSRGITITTTAYGARTVAEYVFALLLALCHRVELHADYLKGTDWTAPGDKQYMCALTPQIELSGMTFGVLGLGNIGLHTAQIAKGFGMETVATDLFHKEGPEYRGIEQVGLNELYRRSDVLSLHLQLSEQTTKMLNQEAFARMKPGIIILNTSRGGVIDEEALADALDSGHVAGAGLDVLSHEPPVSPAALRLIAHRNAIVTGHIAWLPKSSRLRQVALAISNFRAWLDGKPVSVIEG
jgi:glycerate dehydrogenase